MQTVTFKSVYRATLRAWSRDPDTANLTSLEQEVFADRITAAAAEGVQHAFWPDYMAIEQRMFRDAWSGSTTYALGAEIYYSGSYYTSLQAANLNKNPATETTWWELTTELDRYIAWAQTGKTEIGTPKAISKRNPRVSRYPDYLPFTLSENGIQVTDLAPEEVYLEFRKRPPRFTRVAWSAAVMGCWDMRTVRSPCRPAGSSQVRKTCPLRQVAWRWVATEKISRPRCLAFSTRLLA